MHKENIRVVKGSSWCAQWVWEARTDRRSLANFFYWEDLDVDYLLFFESVSGNEKTRLLLVAALPFPTPRVRFCTRCWNTCVCHRNSIGQMRCEKKTAHCSRSFLETSQTRKHWFTSFPCMRRDAGVSVSPRVPSRKIACDGERDEILR